ncbi:MAG: nicotinate-nucleotide--dimethylbenzimidazole phosphoribosyltransferase [Magnetococcales bacterium]|nr:nicotinate-nucleotide--dimethylbenzimidazole phosphoribosyltransferase [Magnetococcales bacterium]
MAQAWIKQPILPLSKKAQKQARARLNLLFQPAGSLGLFEEAIVHLAGMQQTPIPSLDSGRVVIFAADHGVATATASQGVFSLTQGSTLSQVQEVLNGHSPISILAHHFGFELEVVDVGLLTSSSALVGIIDQRVDSATQDIQCHSAMTEEQLVQAMTVGKRAVERAKEVGADVFIGGEMAVGKSISAAAIASSLLGLPPNNLSGPASGISPSAMARKTAIIERALLYHQPHIHQPLQVLRRLGGFETAALTGAFIACGQKGMPAIVDGFVSAVAALLAVSVHPPLQNWLIFGHRSAEPGQYSVMRALSGQPLLQLDLNVGAGTGAVAALSLLQIACLMNRKRGVSVGEKGE